MPDIAPPVVVEPTNPAAVTQAPPPAAPAEAETQQPAGLPDDLIGIPAIQALLAGSPAALSMKLKGSEDRDEVALVTKHQDALHQAGMMFYKSISGERGVFNALRIHPQDIAAADKAGQLLKVAPDFDQVNHEMSKMGLKHPALTATAPPAALATPQSAAAPPQAASGQLPLVPPAPAAVARKLAAQRILNILPGAPSTGPSPGAGRIMNSVLKPVV